MLRLSICILLSAVPLSSALAQTQQEQSREAELNANLSNVQSVIESARLQGLSGDLSSLEAVVLRLRTMNERPSGQMAYYVPYWLSYADYALASAYLRNGKRAEAAAPLEEAFSLLGTMASPDAETFALLALVAGQRVAVTPPAQIGAALGQARDALEKAVAADPRNARVIYARALADFNTPKQYGGGRVAEKYARTVIEQPQQPARALYPGWGRAESAALLIRILRGSDRTEEAKGIYTRFAAEYPGSAALRLAGQGL